mgnify:CR=1 FL=1
MRRKGLIDGISLKKADGVFILPAEQRSACARALIPARDNGTAIALLYALSIETEPAVRAALVEAMGTQRLGGYKQALEERLKTETAQEVKEAIVWALAEIQRDPLDTRPGPVPEASAPAGDPAAVPPAPGAGALRAARIRAIATVVTTRVVMSQTELRSILANEYRFLLRRSHRVSVASDRRATASKSTRARFRAT